MRKLLDEDRVLEAYELAGEINVGFAATTGSLYRFIEAEALTRRASITVELTGWLSLEWIEEESGWAIPMLSEAALRVTDKVAQRLVWDHREPTRVAIMAEDSQAPWAVSPYGYCAPRTTFKKICLPPSLLHNRTELHHAIAHEYGHVICMTLTDNRAPRWLEEAVAVLEERQFDERLVRDFASGKAEWKKASQLEASFSFGDHPQSVWRAYQQAGLIGRYLAAMYGEDRLHALLAAIGNPCFWGSLTQQLLNRSVTDTALRTIYKLSESELFERALRAISEPSERKTILRL